MNVRVCFLQPYLSQFLLLTSRQTAVSRVLLSLTFILALGASSPVAQAQSYSAQVIHVFDRYSGLDGGDPADSMISFGGMLYGTTDTGGPYGGGGEVYSLDPVTQTEKVLYSFHYNSLDGSGPRGKLLYLNGMIYGTTALGGITTPSDSNGYGTIYSLDPTTHAQKILYRFAGTAGDGARPVAGLTAVTINGITTLYGTTTGEGSGQNGTIFSIQPDGTGYQVLYQFTGAGGDGATPGSALTLVNGLLYGTTQGGGEGVESGGNGYGTIFSLDPATHGVKILYRFQGVATGDGAVPFNDLLNVNGTLYGTTTSGGTNHNPIFPGGVGTVFAYNTARHTERILHRFADLDSNDGSQPYTSLINVNGILVGTTQNSTPTGAGGLLVYLINPDGTGYQFLYNSGDNYVGWEMPSSLVAINGAFYGTGQGGPKATGVAFSLTAPTMTTPSAINDAYTTKYQTAFTVAAPGILGNDHSGNTSFINAALVTGTTHGSLAFHQDGSFQYSPTPGFVGTDTFTYRIANLTFPGNTATVTITVQATAPVAVDNSNNVKYETSLSVPSPGVLGNDSNGGSSPMTALLISTVSHGMLTFSSNGAFTYTPAAGFAGTDSFTYQASNAVGKSNTATATLIVQPTTPTAHDDHGHGYYNTTLTISAPGVLGNDDSGGKAPLSATLVTNVTHGTLTLNSEGSFVYTPINGFVGTDSFTYQVANSIGKGTMATCTITISPVAPTGVNNSNNVKKNTTFTVPAPGVLGNDKNGGSSPMTALLVTTTAHGKLTLSSNGAFTYTPNVGFTGTDSFTYQAVNSVGKSNIATATLIVQ